MGFKKATKTALSIKLAISGTSGSGKTYSALLIAKGLGGKTAVLDTEGGSASLYADLFDFDTWDDMDPRGFPPEFFIYVIKAAEEAGYQNLIIDSLSHEWSGRGGCLEIADAIARAKYKGNTFTAWNEVTPRHNRLIDTILGSSLNIIVTMRSKSDYVINKDEKSGKSTPQKVGLATIQRDGMDYEFTLMFELDRDTHMANPGKDRTHLFSDPIIITEETGRLIASWLTAPPDHKTVTVSSQALAQTIIPPTSPTTAYKMSSVPEPAPTTAPTTAPAQKRKMTPEDFILQEFDNREMAGISHSQILAEFMELLPGIKSLDLSELTDEQKQTLATALWNKKKQQQNV